MRIFNLDQRYRAYKKGFRVAVEFENTEPYWEFEMIVSRYYPDELPYRPNSWMVWRRMLPADNSWMVRRRMLPADSSLDRVLDANFGWRSRHQRTRWNIAVRDERLITMALLQLQD
jgi:hypothetical protein